MFITVEDTDQPGVPPPTHTCILTYFNTALTGSSLVFHAETKEQLMDTI